MMSNPFVSVIVPAYNAQDTIAKCIESLLNQTYPADRFEILIVDNNSKDDTAQIIQKYPVTYLLEDKIQTAYASRNRGIRRAKGEIIALTDSDCIADKNWLMEGISVFENHEIGGASGRIVGATPESYIEEYQMRAGAHNPEKSITEETIKNKCAHIYGGNAFYRKDVFEQVGLFDPKLRGGDDTGMSYRLQWKTNYKLGFNPNAKIFHKNCDTLRELWQQYNRYGASAVILLNRYPEQQGYHCQWCNYTKCTKKQMKDFSPYAFIKPLWWKFLNDILPNTWGMIKHFTIALFTQKKEHKIQAIDLFLKTFCICAKLNGEIKASRKNKLPYFQSVLPD